MIGVRDYRAIQNERARAAILCKLAKMDQRPAPVAQDPLAEAIEHAIVFGFMLGCAAATVVCVILGMALGFFA